MPVTNRYPSNNRATMERAEPVREGSPQKDPADALGPRGLGVNHVTLVGRLAADPEVNTTRAGSVTRLRVATNERPEAEFHSVSPWGSLGQVAASHLRSGRIVYLEGRLHNSAWTASDGTARRGYEVIAEAMQFLDAPPSDRDSRSRAPAAA